MLRDDLIERGCSHPQNAATVTGQTTLASGVVRAEPGEPLVEHRPELRPAWQRDHERGVDPGRVDREKLLEQARIVIPVRLERDAGCVVVPHPRREGKRREIELARAAARRLE